MKPKRIQRKRIRGWRMPAEALYVGRPTMWGNPFSLGQTISGKDIGNDLKETKLDTIEKVLMAYREWMDNTKEGAAIKSKTSPLKGVDLACWCKEGEPCHADILLEIANRPTT